MTESARELVPAFYQMNTPPEERIIKIQRPLFAPMWHCRSENLLAYLRKKRRLEFDAYKIQWSRRSCIHWTRNTLSSMLLNRIVGIVSCTVKMRDGIRSCWWNYRLINYKIWKNMEYVIWIHHKLRHDILFFFILIKIVEDCFRNL